MLPRPDEDLDRAEPDHADLLGCRPVTARGYIWRALRTLRVDFDESPPDEPLDDEPAPAGAPLCRKES